MKFKIGDYIQYHTGAPHEIYKIVSISHQSEDNFTCDVLDIRNHVATNNYLKCANWIIINKEKKGHPLTKVFK